MGKQTRPFTIRMNPATGIVTPPDRDRTIERRLSDLRGLFQDAAATAALIEQGDPVLYRVHAPAIPDETEHLLFGTTVIEPGRVGGEYFMTKGHFHAVEHTAEVYHCLSGRGIILMETRGGQTAEAFLERGQAVYIPPGWAHRSVNTGDRPFVFFYAMPGGAGHDYASFEAAGFLRIVVERDGQPAILPNPRRR